MVNASQHPVSNSLSRPYDQAARLLCAITKGAPGHHYQELRAIGNARPQRIFISVGRIQAGALPLPYRWDGAFHVYYGLAPRAYQGGTRDAVAVAGCCWGDEITKAPPDYLPQPSVMVETSPGKAQTIWLLDQYTAALDRVESVNAKIAIVQGGDTVHNRDRVFRLPGFQNIKPQYVDKPRAWIVEFHPDRRYRLEELEEALASVEVAKAPARTTAPNPRGPLPATVQISLEEYLADAGLTRQGNGQYRGPCLFHPCDCERALVVTTASGVWCCWCSDHPGTAGRAYIAGGPAALLQKAGIPAHPGAWRDRKGHLHLPPIEVQV